MDNEMYMKKTRINSVNLFGTLLFDKESARKQIIKFHYFRDVQYK